MRVVLLGAPGSGKGTQAARLARDLHVSHLAAGDRLRAEVASGSSLGAELEGYLRRGDLVPDEVVLRILWQPLIEAAGAGGYVLDGFPRTLAQAELAHQRGQADGITAQAAVYLAGDPEALVSRLLARATQQGRVDDTEPVIRHRLEVFDRQTRPVIEHFADRGLLVTIDALAPVDDVTAAILRALEPRRQSG